jgi:uncharacterized membrane protein YgdD (TMEM256/DUF423 family)
LNAKTWLVLGASLGALAVLLGAFGAHSLPQYLAAIDVGGSEAIRRLANWETAARYQMYHALALLAVGLLAQRRPYSSLHVAGLAMFLGTLIFSGCLYALVLTGAKVLGAIVPIGGVLLIVGWLALGIAGAAAGPAVEANKSAGREAAS